jgi:hypothetical protein
MLSRNMESYDKSPDRIVVPGNLPYGTWHPYSDDRKRLRPSLGSGGGDSGLDFMVDRSGDGGGNLFLSTLYYVSPWIYQISTILLANG